MGVFDYDYHNMKASYVSLSGFYSMSVEWELLRFDNTLKGILI